MDRNTYTWEVTKTETGELLNSGSYETYLDDKIPEDTPILYTSWSTLTIFNEDKTIKRTQIRKQIPQELPRYNLPSNYGGGHTISWKRIELFLKDEADWSDMTIDEMLNPEFQRGHVWTEDQQISYVEHVLKEGKTGKDIYFNCKGWDKKNDRAEPKYCVDGLQRITAARRFMNNEISIFGGQWKAEDLQYIPQHASFVICDMDFQTEEDVLQWYLDINSTGLEHTQEELDRVRDMKENIK